MEWKNLANIVGKTAPTIGTLLGGGVGGAVGTLIANVLGVEDTPDAVLNELKTNPEATLKLQELQMTHKEKLEELRIEEIKIFLNDKDSARKRETESIKNGDKNTTHNLLALIGVLSFFAMTGYILSYGLGKMSSDEAFIIGNLTGITGAVFKEIYSYYFGSSSGSKSKDIQIQNLKAK